MGRAHRRGDLFGPRGLFRVSVDRLGVDFEEAVDLAVPVVGRRSRPGGSPRAHLSRSSGESARRIIASARPLMNPSRESGKTRNPVAVVDVDAGASPSGRDHRQADRHRFEQDDPAASRRLGRTKTSEPRSRRAASSAETQPANSTRSLRPSRLDCASSSCRVSPSPRISRRACGQRSATILKASSRRSTAFQSTSRPR